MVFIWNIVLKYYIYNRLINLISKTYDEYKIEYEVRNGDTVEDKSAVISNEKSSQVIGTVDSGKWHNEYVQYVIYSSANIIDSFSGTGSIGYVAFINILIIMFL